jgi:hypothetical protein
MGVPPTDTIAQWHVRVRRWIWSKTHWFEAGGLQADANAKAFTEADASADARADASTEAGAHAKTRAAHANTHVPDDFPLATANAHALARKRR